MLLQIPEVLEYVLVHFDFGRQQVRKCAGNHNRLYVC